MPAVLSPPRLAILVPCYNEALTIADVIRAFRTQLPEATVYVFDNNSTDRTAEIAKEAGAVVFRERRQGKGYVLRSMFQRVEADVYVMVDGDGTYPADQVRALIQPVLDHEADMVIGSRLKAGAGSVFKLPNLVVNWTFRWLLNAIFRVHITDLLSGYRAMSRRVVKGLPFLSRGFESETELTVKCLERGYRVVEIPVRLTARPVGSHSKIHVIRDGVVILGTLFALARDYKPLTVFGLVGLLGIAMGFIPGAIVIQEYWATGKILRFPSAILAAGLVISGLVCLLTGLVLHTTARRFQELDYQMQQLLERSRGGPSEDS